MWAAGCGATESPSVGLPSVDTGMDGSFVLPPDDGGAALEDTSVDGGIPWTDVSEGGTHGHGPPYPIVLVHGFAGFQQIGPLAYFFRVADDLRARGETVVTCEVSPFLPPVQRGPMVASAIDQVLRDTGAARVNIIAHSQGGLDARYVISTMHYGDRIASLVTIATPHRGTRVADAFLGLVPGNSALLNATAALLGLAYNSASDRADIHATLAAMSETASPAFNTANPDDPRVTYWSWAGRSNGRDGADACTGSEVPNEYARRDITNLLLQPTVNYLEQGDPVHHVNDGMVEVASARWGVFMGCVPADHFDEVGQIAHLIPDPLSGFDHIGFYRDIVGRLHRAGM